jgi:serine/threonine protein phosphatase PrpC
MLADDQIAEILAAETVERSAAALIDAANEAGGLDNITVVVVEVPHPYQGCTTPQRSPTAVRTHVRDVGA